MNNKIELVIHCDYEFCDMGSVHFTCPSCEKFNIQYGGEWYDLFSYEKDIVPMKCERCNAELQAVYYKNEFCYKIEKYEQLFT